MKLFETQHEKKSAAITLLVAMLLLLLFFVLGLTYYDPPVAFGVEVNFGTTNQGQGTEQPLQAVAAQSQPQEVKPTPQPQAVTPKPKVAATQEVVTQEKSTVSLPEDQKEEPQKPEEVVEAVKETPPAPDPPKPKVSEATKNILKNLLEGQKQTGEVPKGEGDDQQAGDKGKQEGNPYASSYYNTAGPGGSGTGYGLNGRSLQNSGKVPQDCNQEGIVVVRITVDNNGQVIDAQPGVKGTTNSHPCLLAPAKETALLHRWNPDAQAPKRQIGFIVIQFKLSE
ncbi:MAG: energy transducer TonB [Flavobacteriaceae bacterium]